MIKTYAFKGLTAALGAGASNNLTFEILPIANCSVKILNVRAVAWAIDNVTTLMVQQPMNNFIIDQTAGKILGLTQELQISDKSRGVDLGIGLTPSNIAGTLGISTTQLDLLINSDNRFLELNSLTGFKLNYFVQNNGTNPALLSVSFLIEVEDVPQRR